eukprot:TRINITY_DN14842_c0_g1_i1.p1 TRINITY_DN14842_c0_g1~~TRINITY_DN14842_c0_g1_i1.p1  ORF type:complete len:401 (-),score=71.02 TRINITY_DN14842_c0_g1_i1:344-1546(-)
MTYAGGDEVGALVFEYGSSNSKAGFAGEDTPKAVFPSHVGRVSEGPRYYVGTSALSYRRDHMDILSPFKDGIIDDWDLFEQLVEHTYKARLLADSKEHPVLLGEPAFNPNAVREKLTELMFEKYEIPALFIGKNPVLSCFACGKSSGLVLDCGGHGTSATSVSDGYALKKSIVRSPVGGDMLTDFLGNILEQRGVVVRPTYSYKKSADSIIPVEFPNMRPSFHQFHTRELVRDIKDALCRVNETAYDERALAAIPTASYDLPDGQTVELGVERLRVGEALFQPGLLQREGCDANAGLPQLVLQSGNLCDADVRKDLFHNVIVTGGGSLFGNVPERLAHELGQIVAAFKVKTVAPQVPAERRFGAWVGGSILASLGSFHQMWMSRQEYQEHGKLLVEKKCP